MNENTFAKTVAPKGTPFRLCNYFEVYAAIESKDLCNGTREIAGNTAYFVHCATTRGKKTRRLITIYERQCNKSGRFDTVRG